MLCDECWSRQQIKRARGVYSTHVHRVSLASSRRRDGAVMADDGGDVAMRGWLHKEVGSGLKWTRRWFVLSRPTAGAPAVLSYYEDPSDAKPNARAWSLHDCAVTNTRAPRSGHWQFRLNLKAECNTKRVPKWVLSGATREDTLAWVQKLHEEAHVDRSEFQIGVLDIEHASVNGSVDLGRGRVNASTVLQWASRQLGSGLSRRRSQNLATDHASLEASRQRHNLPRAASAAVPPIRSERSRKHTNVAWGELPSAPPVPPSIAHAPIQVSGVELGGRAFDRAVPGEATDRDTVGAAVAAAAAAVPVAASEAKAAPRAATRASSRNQRKAPPFGQSKSFGSSDNARPSGGGTQHTHQHPPPQLGLSKSFTSSASSALAISLKASASGKVGDGRSTGRATDNEADDYYSFQSSGVKGLERLGSDARWRLVALMHGDPARLEALLLGVDVDSATALASIATSSSGGGGGGGGGGGDGGGWPTPSNTTRRKASMTPSTRSTNGWRSSSRKMSTTPPSGQSGGDGGVGCAATASTTPPSSAEGASLPHSTLAKQHSPDRAATFIQRLARGWSTRKRQQSVGSLREELVAAHGADYATRRLPPHSLIGGNERGEGDEGEDDDAGMGMMGPKESHADEEESSVSAGRVEGGCLVLGSLSMDLRAEAPSTWPEGGTTTVGTFSAAPGGSGANEAVALAKLAVSTTLIGRVGTDEMGRLLVEHLEGLGIPLLDTSHVRSVDGASTGVSVQLATSFDGKRAHVVCEGPDSANRGVSDPEVAVACMLLPRRRVGRPSPDVVSGLKGESAAVGTDSTQGAGRDQWSCGTFSEPASMREDSNAASLREEACSLREDEDGEGEEGGEQGGSRVRLVLLQLELPLKAMRKVATEARE